MFHKCTGFISHVPVREEPVESVRKEAENFLCGLFHTWRTSGKSVPGNVWTELLDVFIHAEVQFGGEEHEPHRHAVGRPDTYLLFEHFLFCQVNFYASLKNQQNDNRHESVFQSVTDAVCFIPTCKRRQKISRIIRLNSRS